MYDIIVIKAKLKIMLCFVVYQEIFQTYFKKSPTNIPAAGGANCTLRRDEAS